MWAPTTDYFRAINEAVGNSVVVYTNVSGGLQAIEVWEWSLECSSLHNAATAAGMNASWSIDGTEVGRVHAGVGQTGGQMANSVFGNCRGKQFLIANTHTIVLTNAGFTANQYSGLHVACNIFTATA